MSDTPTSKTKKAVASDYDSRGFASVIAESLFVLLPLIVLTIVLLHRGKSTRDLLASPEWSFAGAVLMGQTLVKLIYAVHAVRKRDVNAEWIAVVVAGTIVLGLAPSLIVLSIMLINESPSTGMIWLQLSLFVFGLTIFLIFGTVAQSVVVEEMAADDD